jgi:uncharacterized protein (TIGR03435 family)
MLDTDDMALLREFARNNSETAFAALVQRHLNLVYSVALRCTASPGDAQDVAQAVFIILARKAARLNDRTVLTGWLYETTRLTAAGWLRTQKRRQAREQEAYMQSTLDQADTDNLWRQLAPHLEAAMSRLNAGERTLLALRFYENKTGAEAAALLGIGEEAAHKRTARALEKLRKIFTKRGISSTTSILAGAISANSVQAAPVGLAVKISAVAVAKGAAAGTSTLILVKGALNLMTWAKAKTIAVFIVAISILTGVSALTVDDYLQHMRELQKAPPTLIIQQTHFDDRFDGFGSAYAGSKMIGRNQPLDAVIRTAYMEKPWQNLRAIFPNNMPRDRYDYMVTVADHPHERFQDLIRKQLGYTAHFVNITTNFYILRAASPEGVKLGANMMLSKRYQLGDKVGLRHIYSSSMEGFCEIIENYFSLSRPVMDQTGLSDFYDITLDWQWQGNGVIPGDQSFERNFKSFSKAIHDQIGLEIISTNMPIQMLVVEKVK